MEGGYAGQEPNAAWAMSLLRTPGYIEAIGAMHRASYRDQLGQLVRFRQSIAEEEEQEEEEVSNPSLDSEDACSVVKAPGTLGILRTLVGVLDSDAEEEARIMEDLDMTPQECLKDASLLPEIVFDEPEVLETVPGPPGSLTQGQNTPMVADAETLTSDIVSQQELRFESANSGRFLISKGITKMVVRQAMESTDMHPRNRHAVFRLHVLRQYSGCLNSLEGLKPAEVPLLESLYPRPLPPLFEGGTLQFSNVAEMQAYVNRLNAELERGAAALTPAVKAMPTGSLVSSTRIYRPETAKTIRTNGASSGETACWQAWSGVASSFWCFRWSFAEGEFGREDADSFWRDRGSSIQGGRAAFAICFSLSGQYPPESCSCTCRSFDSCQERAFDRFCSAPVAQRARMTIAEARQELGLLPALTPATSLTAADIVEIFNPP